MAGHLALFSLNYQLEMQLSVQIPSFFIPLLKNDNDYDDNMCCIGDRGLQSQIEVMSSNLKFILSRNN